MLILASSSPRRKEILSSITHKYKIIVPSFDERITNYKSIKHLVKFLSLNKGLEISKSNPLDYVISADTIVSFNNQIFNKPETKENATKYSNLLNGQTHLVYSNYYILKNSKIIKKNLSINKVFIYPLTEIEIKKYVDSLLPLDKAGGYGIQDKDFINVKILKGNYFSVMGLNKEKLAKDLTELNLI